MTFIWQIDSFLRNLRKQRAWQLKFGCWYRVNVWAYFVWKSSQRLEVQFCIYFADRSKQTVYHHVLGFCDNRNNNCLFSLINFDNLWLCTTLQHLHQYLNLMKIKPQQSNQFLQAFGTNNRKYSWNIIQTYITTINLFLSCA